MKKGQRGSSRQPTARVAKGSAIDVAMAAQLACLLEVSAPKPGNVSPGRHFADAHYEDFLASAAAIGGPLAAAGSRPVGETVRLAVDATARWTRSNTNLGTILLLVPLARGALLLLDGPAAFARRAPVSLAEAERRREGPPRADGTDMSHADLRQSVRQVLDETSVDDARDVYAAIRRASPGGLGRAEEQDVVDEPTATLLEVMQLAAHRDGVAREYATGFEVTFETGVPGLTGARRDGLSWDDAIVETFLTLLAETPDTHVVRRAGAGVADEVSRLARSALEAGGVRTDAGMRAIDAMDRRLRDARNTANPGTTADLTAATIFVVLLGGGWKM